ncbi:CBS domain-containing protein [Geodermatophilus sp. URMC 64]
MTREVVTVAPDTSVKSVAEILATRGFAAVPVVDEEHRLLGIITEADVLRGRVLPDPRLRLRRDEDTGSVPPPALVRGVMTADVRTVEATADVADVARLFVDERLRSIPVVDSGRLVGIVSRRDLVRTLVRPDEQLRADLLRLIESYTGEPGCWNVAVSEGVATIQRTRGTPEVPAETEKDALSTLARTVSGIVGVRGLPAVPSISTRV